jgi:hypothetical protein
MSRVTPIRRLSAIRQALTFVEPVMPWLGLGAVCCSYPVMMCSPVRAGGVAVGVVQLEGGCKGMTGLTGWHRCWSKRDLCVIGAVMWSRWPGE